MPILHLICIVHFTPGTVNLKPSPFVVIHTCLPISCRFSGYIKAVAALMIIALCLTFFAAILNICGLSKSDIRRKYIFYKFATYLAILAGTVLYLKPW